MNILIALQQPKTMLKDIIQKNHVRFQGTQSNCLKEIITRASRAIPCLYHADNAEIFSR